MLTDKARNYKDKIKIGDEVHIKWHGGLGYDGGSRKGKIFNKDDVFLSLVSGNVTTLIYYNDITDLVIMGELL
ncbi:MAG: hypothetical protein MJZ03_04455 [archaeon]|nr:hypothetical protein [archaeon]